MDVSTNELRLIAEIQDGLPLEPQPYAAVGRRLGIGELEVIEAIRRLIERGIIRRFGVVLSHRDLGYRANAMAVWDVPDGAVREIGGRMAALSFVTLCYRRPRRLPDWPYNLFCMIHGRGRDAVLARIAALATGAPLAGAAHAVLFSTRRFKQRGARYGSGDARREAAVA